MTARSWIFSPAALTKKAMVNLCLDFLPPLASLPFSTSPFSGRALEKQPVRLYSRYFLTSTLVLRYSTINPTLPSCETFTRTFCEKKLHNFKILRKIPERFAPAKNFLSINFEAFFL